MSSSKRASNVVRATRPAPHPRVLLAPTCADARAAEAEEAQKAEIAEAFERGRNQGRAEATSALAQRVDEAVARLDREAAAVLEARDQFLHGAEREVASLTLALVSKILLRATQELDDVALASLREILHHVTDCREVAVRVSPDSIAAFRSLSEQLGAVVTAPQAIRWVPDRRVRPTGVVVQTEAGKIDARIESQLEEAATLFDEVWRGRRD